MNFEFDSAQEAYNTLIEYYQSKSLILDHNNLVVVDVGAGMPIHYSNSDYFRDKASTIICIEPNPNFC